MPSVFRKSYKKTDQNTGRELRRKSKKWWIKYRDADGRIRREPAFTDKTASMQLAMDKQRQAERAAAGLTDSLDEHNRHALEKHLVEFEAFLRAKGTTAKHVGQVLQRCRAVVTGCGYCYPGEITGSGVQRFIGELRQKGRSAQTCNFYLQAVRQFLNWMVRDGRMSENPVRMLRPYNVRQDRRHDRRALTAEEFKRLIEAAIEGRVVESVPGPERAMLYLLATWTGLRRKELASLTLKSVDLSQEAASVTVSAAYTKNGREDTIPLHPAIAERLQGWLAERGAIGPLEPLFHLKSPGGGYRRTSKMMQRDLQAARKRWIKEADDDPEERRRREESDFLSYRNDDGLFADFHANRHTFITNLGKAGVYPKLAQSLARHSTIDLTMNVYSHVALDERRAAVASLPAPLLNPLPPSVDTSSTGASVKVVPKMVPSGAQNGAQQLSSAGTEMAPHGTQQTRKGHVRGAGRPKHKSCDDKEFGTAWQPKAPPDSDADGREKGVHPTGFEPVTFGSVAFTGIPNALLMLAKALVFQGFCFALALPKRCRCLENACLWGD